MGRIWESAIRETKKPLNFSGLPKVSATLAGERLRPLGHVSADPFSDRFPREQEPKANKFNETFYVPSAWVFGRIVLCWVAGEAG
jgi:hypothetical protein